MKVLNDVELNQIDQLITRLISQRENGEGCWLARRYRDVDKIKCEDCPFVFCLDEASERAGKYWFYMTFEAMFGDRR